MEWYDETEHAYFRVSDNWRYFVDIVDTSTIRILDVTLSMLYSRHSLSHPYRTLNFFLEFWIFRWNPIIRGPPGLFRNRTNPLRPRWNISAQPNQSQLSSNMSKPPEQISFRGNFYPLESKWIKMRSGVERINSGQYLQSVAKLDIGFSSNDPNTNFSTHCAAFYACKFRVWAPLNASDWVICDEMLHGQ